MSKLNRVVIHNRYTGFSNPELRRKFKLMDWDSLNRLRVGDYIWADLTDLTNMVFQYVRLSITYAEHDNSGKKPTVTLVWGGPYGSSSDGSVTLKQGDLNEIIFGLDDDSAQEIERTIGEAPFKGQVLFYEN